MDLLKNAGVQSEIVCSKQGVVSAEDGRQLEAVQNYRTTAAVLYDAVFIPGGKKHKATLEGQNETKQFLTDMFMHCKTIGAVSEGVDLLSAVKPVNLVAEPFGFTDELNNLQGVVVMRQAHDINAFSLEFLGAVAAHRHWTRYVTV